MNINPFVSLEHALNPITPDKAPDVGLLVQDWDENVDNVAEQIIRTGKSLMIIPVNGAVSTESQENGIVLADAVPDGTMPPTLFYYKGLPENASEGIPVLTIEQGKVKVSHEGRVKELAEALGLLKDDDNVNDPGDHEYR